MQKLNISPCPRCGAHHDCAMDTNTKKQRQPAPGDLTVCIKCMEVLKFTGKMTLRRLTGEEIAELKKNTAFHHQLAKIKIAIATVKVLFPPEHGKN